jgi:hypothetical protein
VADAPPEKTSLVPAAAPSGKRDVATSPYVELANNRLQAVVASGSDVNRVYCAFLEAGSGAFYSSTNNNRPDAGMQKRIVWMVGEAVAQFGLERVARYLQVDPARVQTAAQLAAEVLRKGTPRKEEAGVVFSRFLNYLRFVELQSRGEPLPEMAWFTAR